MGRLRWAIGGVICPVEYWDAGVAGCPEISLQLQRFSFRPHVHGSIPTRKLARSEDKPADSECDGQS